MELNCPNCTTHFTVPDDAIGPKGRKLKCAMCGHTWKQMPAGYEPEAVEEAPKPVMAARPAPPPAPEPLSFEEALEDARNARNDMAARAPDPAPSIPPMPMEMAPTGRARPDPLDGYGDDDVPMESSGGGMPRGLMDEDPLADLDFGGAFDTDADDDGPASPSRSSPFGREPLDSSLDDLLAAEPEPIPELFGRPEFDDDDDGQDGKNSPLTIVLVALIVLMAALGAGAWFGRNAIVAAMPQAESLYSMIGIKLETPGAGLQFKDVTSERVSRNGVDTLVVRGFIANISSSGRKIPQLTLVLFDKTDAPVQRAIVDPPQPNLETGQTTGFRVQLENPDPNARRFEMDWAKPTPEGEH